MLFCPPSHILSSQWKAIHTVSFIPKGWYGEDTKSMSYFHVGLLIWQVWGKQIYNLYISLSTEISTLTWRKWNGTASHLSRNSQAAFSVWLSLVKVHITCYKTDQSFYVPSQLAFSLMDMNTNPWESTAVTSMSAELRERCPGRRVNVRLTLQTQKAFTRIWNHFYPY